MEKAATIPPQSWMKESSAHKIMAALAPDALFVGGCVRNALLGEEVGDIDIATKWTPDIVIEKLEAIGAKVIPTGIDHGTVTAVLNHHRYEITTLRKDVATDGRRATIAFSTDWREDAERRDFTINTLLADCEGNIFDPTGQGVADIRARRVVFVGDPATRIAEDILRILRFFRFHGAYGEGAADQNALDACKAAVDQIPQLSRERITQEFFKILSFKNPSSTLELMFAHNVLSDLSVDLNQLGALCHFQNSYNLAALSPRLFLFAGWERYLLIPKVFQKDMKAIAHILALPDLNEDHAVKVAVYKYGRTATAQALMLELAEDRVKNAYAPEALKIVQKWEIPNFPVSGAKLLAKGLRGPEVGAELARLEQQWMDRGFL